MEATNTTFDALLDPIKDILEQEGKTIDTITGSISLFFAQFFKIISYGFVIKIPSLKQLITDLEINEIPKLLGLNSLPYNTLLGGFYRFNAKYFVKLYQHILQPDWLRVPDLEELGDFRLIDGSLFPTMTNIDWAEYKSEKKSIKLHLSFNLNCMIPTEFLVAKGNSSERSFFLSILQAKITYIADRGYFSFKVLYETAKAKAFFIIRFKDNVLKEIIEKLEITGTIPACFTNVKDCKIKFTNDKNEKTDDEGERIYRMVQFNVNNSKFNIVTNRFDLSTLQIILLYAYRWQIELLFRYIKHSINGIHLFNNSENGVTVQFYIMLIVALLELRLKQTCKLHVKTTVESAQLVIVPENGTTTIVEQNQVQTTNVALANDKTSKTMETKNLTNEYKYFGKVKITPEIWMQNINKIFKEFWKISCHWLHKLKSLIAKPFTYEIIEILST